MHQLPVRCALTVSLLLTSTQHDVTICEVRTPEGYGARWSGDGSMFRGFLEPHVEGAHTHPNVVHYVSK